MTLLMVARRARSFVPLIALDLLFRTSVPHGHAWIPAVHVLLEVASRLARADGSQFLHWRLQKFRNIQFDLFAQAGIFQNLSQLSLFNVGKSAAQRTLHNVVVDHRSPLLVGTVWGAAQRGSRAFITGLEAALSP